MLPLSPTISMTTMLGPGVGVGVGSGVGDGDGVTLGVGDGAGAEGGAGAATGVDDGGGLGYGVVGRGESVPPQALSSSTAKPVVISPPVRWAVWRVMDSPSVDVCPRGLAGQSVCPQVSLHPARSD
jgi:hypothetical protein